MKTFAVYDKLNGCVLGRKCNKYGEIIPLQFKRKHNAFKYLYQEAKERNLEKNCFGVVNDLGDFVYD